MSPSPNDGFQSSLPPELQEIKIRDLKPGESAFASPWAMRVDHNGRLWLNPDAEIKRSYELGSGRRMLIKRTPEGAEVDVSTITDCTYDRSQVDSFLIPVRLVKSPSLLERIMKKLT